MKKFKPYARNNRVPQNVACPEVRVTYHRCPERRRRGGLRRWPPAPPAGPHSDHHGDRPIGHRDQKGESFRHLEVTSISYLYVSLT